MEIKQVDLADLKPHPSNPRVHPASAINKLAASIKEYGWTNPIIASADGMILAGHARCKAAKKAGLKTVPVIFLPFTGEKADAYLIADNRLQQDTYWNTDKLHELIRDLDKSGYDLISTGYDMHEIEDILDDTSVDDAVESLMHTELQRAGGPDTRIRIELRAEREVLTPDLVAEIKKQYTGMGIEVRVT